MTQYRHNSRLRWTTKTQNRYELTRQDGRDGNGRYLQILTIKLEAGVLYQIDLRGENFDPYLKIEDENKNLVAQDDDSGGGLDSLIFFRPQATGTYRLVVTTYAPNTVGWYSYKVQEGR